MTVRTQNKFRPVHTSSDERIVMNCDKWSRPGCLSFLLMSDMPPLLLVEIILLDFLFTFWIFEVSEFIVFGINKKAFVFQSDDEPIRQPEPERVPGGRRLRRVETINRGCEIALPEELFEQEGTVCVWHD